MKLSLVFELLLIFVLLAFAASKNIGKLMIYITLTLFNLYVNFNASISRKNVTLVS